MAASSGCIFVLSHGSMVDMQIPASHSEDFSIAPSIQTTWQEIILMRYQTMTVSIKEDLV